MSADDERHSGEELPEGAESAENVGSAEGNPQMHLPAHLGGALGRTVAAGMRGESLSARGVLAAVGGGRGVAEALTPGLLFLVVYVFTQDPTVSVIAPAALAVLAVIIRLARKETAVSAFSGALGVAICVAATLFTGEGKNYFLPGFFINGAWIIGLGVSLAVRWPLLGFGLGAFTGNWTSWRQQRALFAAATITTSLWFAMFAIRLVVQLPLYFADRTEALGIARLTMGVPLFALVVVFTWLLLSRVSAHAADAGPQSSDE